MRNVSLTSSFSSTLSLGEIEASGAKSLSPSAQAAILACATFGRLIGRRASGWHPAGGTHPQPIDRRTINTLRDRGLMSVRLIGASREARLTSTGKWYARTLCSAIAGPCFSTEGVEPCHTES